MRVAVPGVIEALGQGLPLIAASPLLASVAAKQHAEIQIERGSAAWNRPSIYSLDAWLTYCWTEARYSNQSIPLLLSPAQELVLWENAIHDQESDLFDLSNAARMARQANRVVAEWKVDSSHPAWTEQEDARCFQLWSERIKERCQAQGWITRSDLWSLLPDWIENGLCGSAAVVFAGFDRMSPGLRRLVDSCETATLLTAKSQGVLSQPRRLARSCENFNQELEAAARWARAEFEENTKSSYGVFVPRLAAHQDSVERIFKSTFYPASPLQLLNGSAPLAAKDYPYHVHAATPLWEHPLVAHALLVIELANGRIDQSAASALFRSPFIRGAEAERNRRALADLTLRRRREPDVDIRQMEKAAEGCEELRRSLSDVRELLRAQPAFAETATWSAFIADLLSTVGWPGDRELTADDQDLVEAWKDALSELGSLSLVTPAVPFDAVRSHLKRLLGKSRTELGDWFSPVQILDASEACGLEFDSAFAVGMSDDSWPPPPLPPPLIPPQLRREYLLPESTPDLVHSERRRLSAGLLSSAPEVRVTYSGRLSPLIAMAVKVEDDQWPEWMGKTPFQSFKPVSPETVEDTYAPPFDPGGGVRGGTTIIKLQSSCPFRAFAEIRLRSRAPESACFGLDARDRGGFLHKAMQYVWEELKDKRSLQKMPETWLRALVTTSVSRAVTDSGDSEFQAQTAEVERKRLSELIYEWLITVEKNRLQDFSVETVETDFEFNLAGLPLRLRLDRMDRLANGQLVLIDYKSGEVTKGKLSCPRPEEPQLLVYAAAKGAEVDGVFFGQINRTGLKLPGVSRDRHVKGIGNEILNSKWEQRTSEWTADVEGRAIEFLQGYAAVDPVRCACDFCENKPLCRIREKTATDDEETR